MNDLKQKAFTLVEILVVLIIISLMGSMVVTAVSGVTNTAKLARTRSIIASIDSVIQEKYEGFMYRAFPVVTPDVSFTPTTVNGDPDTFVLSYEIFAAEAARMRLLMRRDLQRMEIPDQVTDIWDAANKRAPASLTGAANFIAERTGSVSTGTLISTSDDKSKRRSFQAIWFSASNNYPSTFLAYHDRTSSSWDSENQGAECLFLMMSTSMVGGIPAIDSIPSTNIDDTDGDGVPEILDGWGQPLGFLRWPVGFSDAYGSVLRTVPDETDLFRVDFGFKSAAYAVPWAIRPLIISAGADGEFGVAFTPHTDTVPETSFDYSLQTWPITNVAMSGEELGRMPLPAGVTSYIFIDPYLRQYTNDTTKTYLLPGDPIPASMDSDAKEYRVDNITNFSLQVE